MAYINGRKILTCIYGGEVIPIVFKIAKGDGDGVGVLILATLADVNPYSLWELGGKSLSDFK